MKKSIETKDIAKEYIAQLVNAKDDINDEPQAKKFMAYAELAGDLLTEYADVSLTTLRRIENDVQRLHGHLESQEIVDTIAEKYFG